MASVMSCLNLVKCVHSSQPIKHMGISLNKIPAEMKQNKTQCLEKIEVLLKLWAGMEGRSGFFSLADSKWIALEQT